MHPKRASKRLAPACFSHLVEQHISRLFVGRGLQFGGDRLRSDPSSPPFKGCHRNAREQARETHKQVNRKINSKGCYDRSEQGGSDAPEKPFLFAISLHTLPCDPDRAKALLINSNIDQQGQETTPQTDQDKLVANIKHHKSPVAVSFRPKQPPVSEMTNAIIHKHVAMVTG